MALLTALALPFSTSGQNWLQDTHIEIYHAVAPVYLNFEPEPAAIFRVDHIFSDYQTRGFFRIGALPVLVLDKATLELKDFSRLTNALSQLGARLTVKKGLKKAVEARTFRLCLPAKEDGWVCARLARLETATEWRLQDGTVQRPGYEPVSFRTATLAIAGPHAGELVFQTHAGLSRFPLSSLLSK